MLTIRKRNISILCFLLVWSTFTAMGQSVISGIIREASDRKIMPEVICMLTDASGKTMLDYGFTDKDGKYDLRTTHEGDSLILTVRMMSYRTVTLRLPNRSQTKDILLQDENFKLKEVVVKADPITQHGDTINYNVASLKSAKDIAIVDVIKKLPGVEVSESGKISYQGKAINKFYIEGMDLLGGKYSLATTSVPVDAVASIQVLENHQPIRALEETQLSERAAMNLKLKKGKKLRPVGQVTLGGGISDERFKYMGALSSLQLSDKAQSMLTLKANNSGTQLANELIEHTYQGGDIFNALPYSPTPLVSPSEGYLPPVPAQNGIFNESYMGSYNQLFKLKKDWEVKVNGSYVDEKLESTQEETTVYDVTGENPLTIVSNQASENHHRQGNLSFLVTRNAPDQYVNNQFRLTGDWSEARSQLTGTNPSLQDFEQPFYLLENKLSYLSKRFAFRSFIRYQSQPQNVSFSVGDSLTRTQERSEKLFHTNNDIQWNHFFGSSELSFKAGLQLETNRVRSFMDEVPDFLSDSTTRSKWNYLQASVFLNPSYAYKGNGYSLTLSVPMSWQKTDAEKETQEKWSFHHFVWMPSVRFYWKINHFWEFMASGSFKRSPSSYKNLNDTYYYKNRNLLQRGIDELGTNEQTQATLNLYYRNPFNVLWSRLNVIYTQNESDLISGYDFAGTQPISTWHMADRSYKQFRVHVNVGKIVDAIHTNLSANVTYSHTLFTQYQQSTLRETRSNQMSMMLTSNTRITSWWDWELQWLSSFSHNKGYETLWNHKLGTSMTFSAGKWSFIPKLDYTRNQMDADTFKDAALLHATLRYKLKMWSFDVECHNLLDTRKYILRSNNGLNQYDQLYVLRPRQVMAKVRFMF